MMLSRFILKELKKHTDLLILIPLILVSIYIILIISLELPQAEHYIYLADALLNGRLDIDSSNPLFNQLDMALFEGKSYVIWSFLPALYFVPFVYIWGLQFNQGFLLIFFDFILFYLVYKLTFKIGFSKKDSIWLSLVYIIGSAMWGIVVFPVSCNLPHLIGSIFLFFALNEFFNQKRWYVIGTFLGLASLTRINFLINSSFFILYLVIYTKNKKSLLKKIVYFCLPIIFFLLIYGLYNFYRFGSFIEFGYSYHLLTISETSPKISLGFMLKNAYVFFIKPPIIKTDNILKLKAPISGFGFLFSSFSFLLIGIKKKFYKSELVKLLVVPLIIGILISLIWYSHGGAQFGYRFILDYQPFLYLILLLKLYPKVQKKHKIIMFSSMILNIYLSLIFLR